VTAEGPYKGTVIKVGTPTTIHGVLEFHSGAIVTIGASWDVVQPRPPQHRALRHRGHGLRARPELLRRRRGDHRPAGAKTKVEPVGPPFGKINQTDNSGNRRANYRTAGLADMMQAIEEGRPARCGLDVALHAVDVMTSLLKAGESGQVVTLTTTCERPRRSARTKRGRCCADVRQAMQGRRPVHAPAAHRQGPATSLARSRPAFQGTRFAPVFAGAPNPGGSPRQLNGSCQCWR
jgi:hypothetical protein